VAALLFFAATACGPEGRSLGDACPNLPLYRFEFDKNTGTWKRLPPSSREGGDPLGASDLAKIAAADET
jgi:hypothetical protein